MLRPREGRDLPKVTREPEAEPAPPYPLLGFVCAAASRQPASWHSDSELLGADKQDPGEDRTS